MKQGDWFLFNLFTVSLKCHTGQYGQSQALQLTVDSFGKRNFLVAYGKKSLEEILIKYGLWPEINHRIVGSSEFRRSHGLHG